MSPPCRPKGEYRSAQHEGASVNTTATPPAPPLPEGVIALVPMRNVVLFPHVLMPISVGRAKSIAALQYALQANAPLGIVMQKDAQVDDPGRDALCDVGTVANVVRHIGGADELQHVVCQGMQRFRVGELVAGYRSSPPASSCSRSRRSSRPRPRRWACNCASVRSRCCRCCRTCRPSSRGAAGHRGPRRAGRHGRQPHRHRARRQADDARIAKVRDRLDRVIEFLTQRVEVLKLSKEIGEQTRASSTSASASTCCASS